MRWFGNVQRRVKFENKEKGKSLMPSQDKFKKKNDKLNRKKSNMILLFIFFLFVGGGGGVGVEVEE